MSRPGFRTKPEPTRAEVVKRHNHVLQVAIAGERELRRLKRQNGILVFLLVLASGLAIAGWRLAFT